MAKEISLTNTHEQVLVDDSDYRMLVEFSDWRFDGKRVTSTKTKEIRNLLEKNNWNKKILEEI